MTDAERETLRGMGYREARVAWECSAGGAFCDRDESVVFPRQVDLVRFLTAVEFWLADSRGDEGVYMPVESGTVMLPPGLHAGTWGIVHTTWDEGPPDGSERNARRTKRWHLALRGWRMEPEWVSEVDEALLFGRREHVEDFWDVVKPLPRARMARRTDCWNSGAATTITRLDLSDDERTRYDQRRCSS